MTGFGQATGGRSPFKWSVELRSWNHRFFECSTRLPNVLSGLDERIRDLIHGHIKRGKITVSIALKSKPNESNGLILDQKKIGLYIKTMRKIQKKHRLEDSLSIGALMSVPNLFIVDHKEYTADQYWNSLKQVLEEAVKSLLHAKAKEGAALTRDMSKRISLILNAISHVKKLAEKEPGEHRNRLKEKLQELVQNVQVDSGRLEQEIAFLAERNDITEELVRTEHHLDFLKKSIAGSGEVGKKLDFIAQEIHREANTIASKAQSSQIAEEVIKIKSELEKIREQVQNIE